jgi:hypothetical protein
MLHWANWAVRERAKTRNRTITDSANPGFLYCVSLGGQGVRSLTDRAPAPSQVTPYGFLRFEVDIPGFKRIMA